MINKDLEVTKVTLDGVDIPVIKGVDISQTTATAGDVLEGKEFYNASGEKVAGTYKDMLQARVDINNSCYKLFAQYPYATLIDISKLDMSKVTSTSYMFDNSSALTSLNLNGLDTSNVADMSFMFNECYMLETLDASGLDTSNVTNMAGMFKLASKYTQGSSDKFSRLTELILPTNFDTSKATKMSQMFYCLRNIQTLDLSNFDTSNVTEMSAMFYGCYNLRNLNISSFNTSNVPNMANMFYACKGLTSLDLSHFNTTNVTNMAGMFQYCEKLSNLNISNFNTANVTNMNSMFYNNYQLTSLDLSSFDTSKVTNMGNMFYVCQRLVTILGVLDLILIPNNNSTMYYGMFQGCKELVDVRLKNIKCALTLGSGTSYGTKLSLDTLYNTIYELHSVTTTYKLTLSTASKTSLADKYVKLVDITDTTLYVNKDKPFLQVASTDANAISIVDYASSDPYISNKKPFVVCESTDEGAMLITEYVTTQKKWTLA